MNISVSGAAGLSQLNQLNQLGEFVGTNESSNVGVEFMTLLLAQLKNQNPLEPMDESAWIQQLTQISSLQELQAIKTSIVAANNSNKLTEAAVLIGKTVTVSNGTGEIQSGVVTGVSLEFGVVKIAIGDKKYSISDLIEVQESEG